MSQVGRKRDLRVWEWGFALGACRWLGAVPRSPGHSNASSNTPGGTCPTSCPHSLSLCMKYALGTASPRPDPLRH